MSKGGSEAREFIADLTRIGVDALAKHAQLGPDHARKVMQAITDQVCLEYNGHDLYVPVAFDPRNRKIVEEFHQSTRAARACTPARVRELALEYALTTRQVYGILREARLADFNARQGSLDLEDPSA